MVNLSWSWLNPPKQIQCAKHIVNIISTYLIIENCENNYQQHCGKKKIANVTSVNECHKIVTSSRARKTEPIRLRQSVPGQSKLVSKL